MLPVGRYFDLIAQHQQAALLIGAPNVDDSATPSHLVIAPPPARKLPPRRCRFHARRFALAIGGDILPRLLLQLCEAGVFKATPDLRLPQTVIAFYAILQ